MQIINKITKFLNEEDLDNKKISSIIRTNCSDFLKFAGSSSIPLFRGETNPTSITDSNLIPFEVRKDRKPKDTNIELDKLLNTGFYSAFGNTRAEALFCTGSKAAASEHGKVHRIFPIGKVEFIWSQDIKDLTEIEPSDLYEDLNVRKYPKVAAFILYFYMKQNNLDKSSSRRRPNYMEALKDEFEDEFNDMFDYFKFTPNDETWKTDFMSILEQNKVQCAKSFVNYYYKDKNFDLALNSLNEIMVFCDKYYALPVNFELL